MSALSDKLATGASTVARAWIVRRKDGVELGFTDHDGDLVVDGVICRAASGLTASALQASTGLAVDNSEVAGALSNDALSAADIRAGRWDDAKVVAYLVDWSTPATFDILFRGSLGEITESGERFTAELRGLAEALNTTRGRVYHGRCDAVLGDGRCGLDMSVGGRVFVGRIIRVEEDGRRLWVGAAAGQPDHWFDRGRARFTRGAAENLIATIKSDEASGSGRILELWSAPGAVPAVDDAVELHAGCDKAMVMCRDKFANIRNYRGFPHIPGDDWLMSVPALGAS